MYLNIILSMSCVCSKSTNSDTGLSLAFINFTVDVLQQVCGCHSNAKCSFTGIQ